MRPSADIVPEGTRPLALYKDGIRIHHRKDLGQIKRDGERERERQREREGVMDEREGEGEERARRERVTWYNNYFK